MSPITSHVLDTATGRPAKNLAIRLSVEDDAGHWTTVAERRTDDDGRVTDLLAAGALEPRTYRMTFEVGHYLRGSGRPAFYPQVEIIFQVDAASEHYHIPLLLSPFGYSTYRGS